MMPKRLTSQHEEIFRLEAERRAVSRSPRNRFSSKELAARTGFSPNYVASLISKMRREFESRVDVSRETITRERPKVNS